MKFEALNQAIQRAAELISKADSLLFTAGAGMGVDSGLPDFRGNEGFWKAYPPYRKLGRSFIEMANPQGFSSDPAFAWGFYGHRLNLYRETKPHEGFQILLEWGRAKPGGCAVMTSNVDGHFQQAGFDREPVYEIHGSINHFQCTLPCGDEIWSAQGLEIEVDEETMRARQPLPRCPHCDAVARPNILMFGDWNYIGNRNDEQRRLFDAWLAERRESRIVILEFGAGKAVPTVRMFSEEVCRQSPEATLIRFNPRDPEVPRDRDVSIASGALESILAIASCRLEES